MCDTHFSKERLILEVQNRPILWQDNHSDHKNKALCDKLWSEIAEICNVQVTTAKSKWRNLRDNFRKEYQKYQKLKQRTVAVVPVKRPKWQYFDQLSFLQSCIPSKVNLEVEEDFKEDFHENTSTDREPYNTIEEILSLPMSPQQSLPLPPPPSALPQQSSYAELPRINNLPSTSSYRAIKGSHRTIEGSYRTTEGSRRRITGSSRRHKRRLGQIRQELLEIEKRKYILLQEDANRQRKIENDSDLLFFKSLLPFIKEFSEVKKLKIKSKILQMIIIEKEKEESK